MPAGYTIPHSYGFQEHLQLWLLLPWADGITRRCSFVPDGESGTGWKFPIRNEADPCVIQKSSPTRGAADVALNLVLAHEPVSRRHSCP